MRRRILLALALLPLLIACQVDTTDTRAVPAELLGSTSATPTSTAATPVSLPFENRFPNRWNPSNDGTSYEPCVAFSDEELRRFQVDPWEIEDAALVNGQGIRGCSWTMPDSFSMSQLVTNSQSLEAYKRGTIENDWHSDFAVEDRVVGFFSLVHGTSKACSTYVQSGSAAVVTHIIPSTSAKGTTIDTCKLAIDFTSAYIDKIPE